MIRSLETECRRSAELQEMLSAAERRGGELPATGEEDQSLTELKSQLDDQLRRTAELQGLIDDESRKLSADKVTRSQY